MNYRRALELIALFMIGDAIVALITPEKYLRLWRIGPEPCRDLVDQLARHPHATRGLAALELGAGLWLALRETEN